MRLAAGLWAMLAAATAFADIIHLKDGRTIEGRVIEEGFSYVRIETDKGEIEVDRDEVERIERKPWTPPPKKEAGPEKRKPDSGPAQGNTPLPPKPAVRLEVCYREAVNNYRMNFPKGWERGTPAEGIVASFLGPAAAGFRPQIDLRIDRSELGLKEYMAKLVDAEKVELKEPLDLKMGAHPAKRFVVEGPTTKQLRLVIDDGKRKFLATFAAPPAGFDAARPGVESAILSLRVFPENPLTPERKTEYLDLAKQVEQQLSAKNTKEALKLLEKCKEYVPNYPDLYNAVATAYSYEHNWRKAADGLQQAVKLDGDCFEYRYYLANFLLAVTKSAEAEKHAIRATEIDPWNEGGWVNLGIVQTKRGQYAKARAAYEKALEVNPKSVSAHYNLGVLYEAQGMTEPASDEYNAALKLDPANALVKQALERLKSGK
ncbi:MAG TPA: tetratricopeptide repeat protein [Planctomycetota bacterium]|nr:tetratricopeptide repeat protein [Planctomycetota bacterium]